ncbi:unnamed protein product [Withania somnifera]
MACLNSSKNKKAKRSHEEDSDKEWIPSAENVSSDSHAKSPKKIKIENSEVNKSAYQRVWSEEEEIAILQGHLNYSLLKGAKPSSDYAAFFTFVKDKLQPQTSKTQLQDKLTRLKKKYTRNVSKRRFSKPHEEKLFKLSKKIWGLKTSEKTIVGAGSSTSEMSSDLVLGGGSAADLEDWFMRNPRQLISEKDRTEMLDKSQSIKIAKAKQYLLEIQVMEEQAKLATDALQALLT